jgi:hypothetical protein
MHHKIIYIGVQLDVTYLLFYLKQLYTFRAFLPIIRSSYTAWSAIVYGKWKCGRAVWCPVVSLVWSVLPWHCLSLKLRQCQYSALGPVSAGTRAQSGNQYGSGMLHSGQVLTGGLPLLSPAFRRSHFRCQMPPCPLLGAFTILWKVSIIYTASVCPLVNMEQFSFHWTDFHDIWVFSKICWENSSFIKIWH